MCGICGVAYADAARPAERSRLESMLGTLVHRGPDDEGVHLDGPVALGHRRLSIVDPEGGHQPLAGEHGDVWIAVNGEVYNHPALHSDLVAGGHRYGSRSDSESIVHLYQEHGVDCLPRLRGMFAFSLWDAERRRLLLARDRLGIKPLYYWTSASGDLVWGSEIKAILASGLMEGRLALEAVPEYLVNRYTSGQRTFFRGIRRLLPGHVLLWEDGQITERPFWRPDGLLRDGGEPGSGSLLHGEDPVDAFSRAFEDAVRSHLMSDVPVGVFLSGGLDSSAIAATMREMVGDRLRTFSVGYPDSEASELPYARRLADHLGAEHREIEVTADMFFDSLPDLVWHEDGPIAFPSSVPLYHVAELASGFVKVVLTGEGSDELLAGYGKYTRTLWNLRMGRRYERAPAGLRHGIRRLIDLLPDASRTVQRLERTFLSRPADVESLYFDNFGVFRASDMRRLLSPPVLEAGAVRACDPFSEQRRRWAESAAMPLLTRLQYVDVLTYLHELLMKQDRMSMAASIESRVPFLDTPLVELAFRLPEAARLDGLTGKQVLRRAMEDRLPDEILHRRKMGFPTPVGRWLADSHWSWVEDCVLDPARLTAGLFDQDCVARLAREHRDGERDHTERLWSLMNLELWAREFPGVTTAPTPS